MKISDGHDFVRRLYTQDECEICGGKATDHRARAADDARAFQAQVLTVARNVRKDGPPVLINIVSGGESRRGTFAEARTFLDELEQQIVTRGQS